jgi:hypothetical protein
MASRIDLKNGRSAENSAYARKRTTSKLMVATVPKVNFRPDGSTSPVNYGYTFMVLINIKKPR